jgi:hypothetical protein
LMLARCCAGLDTSRVPRTHVRKETEEDAMVRIDEMVQAVLAVDIYWLNWCAATLRTLSHRWAREHEQNLVGLESAGTG